GALLSSVKPLPIIGVFVLMISALLTAGYLLTISIRAFFPVTKTERVESCEANNFMTVPLIILTLGIVFFGVFPTPLVGFVQKLAQSLTI
ncbi:MAG: proton-conducting membrane transporter, partial [Oscillospiraceae bacterium]